MNAFSVMFKSEFGEGYGYSALKNCGAQVQCHEKYSMVSEMQTIQLKVVSYLKVKC